ncbi:putative ABC transporter permease [Clostridium sp. Marseille-P3244]|uniref:putative ABC transporter permease n=1 Tax=Clostridium sp. Marseille-P3244 TaxID=1871020 RepID=UPI00093117EF|nr:putative ABC transporter permease [Clostridium sp. Marseille-P3244]
MHSYDLTQWVLFFFIYSFIGWVWESCYVSLRKRRWVNRGFMHGPMLPLYGSGALVVLVSTIGVRDNVVLIFVLGMSAATILEYFTGAVMESLFHVRYWDYSSQKLNLKGYICVTSSLCWGCFSVLLVRVVHLPIEAAVLRLPSAAATWISMILAVTAAVDLTQSFNEAMDMRRLLAQLEESKKQIRKMQDKLRVTTEEVREDYRKYLQERSEKKLTRRKAYLERINMKRIETQDLLSDLYERTDQLLREELPSKVNSLIGEERRADLLTLKQNIKEELRKMSSRTDRGYLRVAEHLRRNPTAVSERFKEALEEIRRIMGG